MNGVKKKIIIAMIIIGSLALLIGSFFLRDLCLRAGLAEYEKQEILQVRSKYSATIEKIAEKGREYASFSVTSKHGGLFEKSVIIGDDNGELLVSKLGEEIDVLCHTYCYRIYGKDGSVYFAFNERGSKLIVNSDLEPQKNSEKDTLEKLSDGWYYLEYSE